MSYQNRKYLMNLMGSLLTDVHSTESQQKDTVGQVYFLLSTNLILLKKDDKLIKEILTFLKLPSVVYFEGFLPTRQMYSFYSDSIPTTCPICFTEDDLCPFDYEVNLEKSILEKSTLEKSTVKSAEKEEVPVKSVKTKDSEIKNIKLTLGELTIDIPPTTKKCNCLDCRMQRTEDEKRVFRDDDSLTCDSSTCDSEKSDVPSVGEVD